MSHLLAVGTAALLVFAVGFRLLPRFLDAGTDRRLPWVVLPAGALGPAVIAVGIPSGPLLHAGAGLEAVAMVGWVVAYGGLYRATDRDRVGLYGPLVGAVAGLAGVTLGLSMAVGPVTESLAIAHYRLNVLGFLGLTIVGVTYQFYPPAIGEFPGAGDRLALASIALVGAGLAVEVVGALAAVGVVTTVGRAVSFLGAFAYAYLVLGVFVERALD